MKRKTAGNIIDLDDGNMILDPSVELHRAIDKYQQQPHKIYRKQLLAPAGAKLLLKRQVSLLRYRMIKIFLQFHQFQREYWCRFTRRTYIHKSYVESNTLRLVIADCVSETTWLELLVHVQLSPQEKNLNLQQ